MGINIHFLFINGKNTFFITSFMFLNQIFVDLIGTNCIIIFGQKLGAAVMVDV